MTDTNKDKIRIDKAELYENEYKLTTNKFEIKPLKDFINGELHRVLQEILYQTGEDYICFNGADLNIIFEEEKGEYNNLFKYKTYFNIYYSELESDKEYKNRLNQLKVEETKLKELAIKFGYKLEKVSD